ncbi:glycoside hydrolase family 2 TIM barrel-domain containing protein [Mucilaginibacter puniceus]
MRKTLFTLLILIAVITQGSAQSRNVMTFDAGWTFNRGDVKGAEEPSFNDKDWRTVTAPHDWSIEDLPGQSDTIIGPFYRKSIGGTATGYTIGGTGWYRKGFNLNNTAGKKVAIYFDGVYMNSDVWVNGQHLGNHPYGYSPFFYDITPYVSSAKKNVIAVRVRNEGKTSRWYSGSGIYRHVKLIITDDTHIDQWGITITTPRVTTKSATVNVQTNLVANIGNTPIKVSTTILDAKNRVVAKTEKTVTGNSTGQNITINSPMLWSPSSPYLYRAVSEVKKGNKVIDHVTNTFGIRSIEFSAEKGFLLNGKKTLLKGGCVHNDNGPLGGSTVDRAEERKVELLKKNGFNAVRTSHNPPSEQFLDACDRLGLVVIDEAFDMWERQKNAQDYHLYFNDWWKKDLDAIINRDRNHPSIVFWSIGNEINERVEPSGLAIERKLIDEVKRLDKTRPVTEAICSFYDHPGFKWDTTAAAFAMLDVGSYNYMRKEYESDHVKHPDRIMMGTESYPREALTNWDLVEKHPYVIGDFVWTAMDYLGETGLGHTSLQARSPQLMPYPWFNGWCGDIDLIGDKKPQMYYRDVVWRNSKMNVLVHSPIPAGSKETVSQWGWPDELPYYNLPGSEGKIITVNVYTRYPEVRLELNGKVIGQKKVTADNLTANFELEYQPGTLKAVALDDNGKVADTQILTTPGKAYKIRLTADRSSIKKSTNDLSYITAEIVDEQGRLVSDANATLQFDVTGDGEITAVASADPKDMQSFKKPEHRTFRGKCLVVIRPNGKAGQVVLQARGDGLKADKIAINIK